MMTSSTFAVTVGSVSNTRTVRATRRFRERGHLNLFWDVMKYVVEHCEVEFMILEFESPVTPEAGLNCLADLAVTAANIQHASSVRVGGACKL